VTLFINGVETPLESAYSCWGDLVAAIDRGLAAAEAVVTAVRMDGVEEPAFREPAVCARPLAEIERITVETGRPEDLARLCLTDAIEGLSSLRSLAGLSARDFQAGDVETGCQNLEQLSQGLVTVLQIVAAAGIALRAELDRVDDAGHTLGGLSSTTDDVISRLVTEQQNEDWVQVADILEFELDPLLVDWQGLLTHIVSCG
jgi:hypothetical protein